jgi:hypothetical protein
MCEAGVDGHDMRATSSPSSTDQAPCVMQSCAMPCCFLLMVSITNSLRTPGAQQQGHGTLLLWQGWAALQQGPLLTASTSSVLPHASSACW